MDATRLAPIAALTMVLPVVMALAACAPTSCTAPSTVKVVADDPGAVSLSCDSGCGDDTVIERLGNEADRTWKLSFPGSEPARLKLSVHGSGGAVLTTSTLTPKWQSDDDTASCQAGWANDLRILASS